MSSPDGRYHISFNGEIYNHEELREDLEARGHVFRGSSDTEVLLQLIGYVGAPAVREAMLTASRVFAELRAGR